MRTKLIARLVVAVLGATFIAVSSGGPAAADVGSPVGLGIRNYADMVVDTARGQLFFSPGYNGTEVRVTDLSGGAQRTIPGLPGATGMTLSPDGGTLYVALQKEDVIAAVDTTTLTETRRHRLGSDICPTWLRPAGGKIYFGYGCVFGKGLLGSLDVRGETPVLALNLPLDRVPVAPPLLRTSPGDPDLLMVADRATSPSTLPGWPAIYDVSSGTPVKAAALPGEDCSGLHDAALTPDAAKMILACRFLSDRTTKATEHAAFSTTDLSPAGRYPSGAYPIAVTTSPNGAFVIAGTSDRSSTGLSTIYVQRPDGTLVHRYDLPPGRHLERQGLAVSADSGTLYAVTTGEDALDPNLYVLTDYTRTGVSLALSAPSSVEGGPVTLSGRLSFHGGAVTSPQTLQVSRQDWIGTVRLPDGTTAADGTFSLSDLPTSIGWNTYTVSRPGDATHAAVTRSVRVFVSSGASSITLSVRRSTAPVGRHLVTGTLAFGGASVSTPWTLQVVRKDATGTHPMPAVVTGADGTFSFPINLWGTASSTYTVTFAATAVWRGSSQSVTVRPILTGTASRFGSRATSGHRFPR
ncbi:YncE family protein [Micromonospora cathayae]|uniref:40-residue YVTN family beta-propeller repeat-containing protein n=1 Tax=Micromonospora cathayae TaxID=3028804 RepID=A0ABY7ZUH1_9ACTN|nr:hypothetical protein [Micromonospora sp. HUAS 3]WDZ85797.1 hypothetical protein PVK37_04985 [Micromonospora sp. HUAS 3]